MRKKNILHGFYQLRPVQRAQGRENHSYEQSGGHGLSKHCVSGDLTHGNRRRWNLDKIV